MGHTILVGGAPTQCTDGEWAAATAEDHERIEYRKAGGPWRAGIYVGSYYYDGVVAQVIEVDPDDLIEHSLFLGLGTGDDMRRLS